MPSQIPMASLASVQYVWSSFHLHPYHVLKPRFQFQPISSGASPTYDLILGTSFRESHDSSSHRLSYIYMTPLLVTTRQVRNVYLLVDYGDFVDGSVNTTAGPYVQLLSITDPTAAHADFVNVRLNDHHTNNNTPSHTVGAFRAKPKSKSRPTVIDAYRPSSKAQHTNNATSTHSSSHVGALRATPRPNMADDVHQPNSSSSNNNPKGAFLKEKLPIIIVLSIGGVLVLMGLVAVCCSRDWLGKRGRGGLANTYQSYQRLGAPAPSGDMHQVQGYRGHGGPPMYTNSWGRR